MAGRRTVRNVPLALRPYIISSALPLVVDMLRRDGVRVAFSTRKGRTLGYYMPPRTIRSDVKTQVSGLHTISLQVDLNPYALLFVFLHEWAHLLTQKQYGNEVFPHGREWKKNFKTLFKPFFRPEIFPEDILEVIAGYFNKTSRYFEKELEDACNRYGKDRKAFAATYIRLLGQGIVIPAPYMGIAAEKRREALRQEREKREGETEKAAATASRKRQEPVRPQWKVAEKKAISGMEPGSYVRLEGKDYEVIRRLSPFVVVCDRDTRSQIKIHGLVEVERLVMLAENELR